ncbi:putative DNA helicase [Ralstonia phage RSJ2]|uniref:Putative DNA helicase n=1 Tax=Ralstonia phage RSJ2 TaxID=1481785 RepID=A0A068Q6G7_9CAUD|nr:putative DNA helicase [Ralstonia phage RSJ2]BAP15822.1 putative DNA helicase [Ralstonia phage RSJ2]
MSLETTLLRLLKSRSRYERLARSIPKHALDTRTQAVLNDYGYFFEEFPDAACIEYESFWTFFKLKHPTLKEEDRALYGSLLRNVIEVEADPALEDGLMGRLLAADYANRLASYIQKWQDGETEEDLYVGFRALMDNYESEITRKVKIPWVNADINDILNDAKNDRGFHFRLKCINRVMRPLIGGDFIVLAARPDKGKTTMIASELTYMAEQIDTVYPDEQRDILWFNNEGPGRRIVQRNYQAALNAKISDLIHLSQNGVIREEYVKACGGRDVIKVMDIHDFWSHEVEDIMRMHKPAIVVFDMVDNIKFGGAVNNGGQRTDQLLEAMYQWARLLGVKYDCAVIATSQVSADGDGLSFPTLPMLKDSKTGKQGAADAIIVMGSLNDPMYAGSRWIGMTKNKLQREGAPKSCDAEVIFDAERARLIDPPENS